MDRQPQVDAPLSTYPGNLNRVPYLPDACICDALEPFKEPWEHSLYRSRVRRIYSDLQDVPQNAGYDCVFSGVEIRRLPSPLIHLSVYTTVFARRPRIDRCRSFDVSRTISGALSHE
jgi:hypothetical protein